MKLQQFGTQINQGPESELKIYGNSSEGVVESIYEYSGFNLYQANNLDIANKKENSRLFKGDRTFVKGYGLETIYTWNKDGGNYPDSTIKDEFEDNDYFNTYIGLYGDLKNNDVSAEVFGSSEEARENFQTVNYGRVVFKAGSGGPGGTGN